MGGRKTGNVKRHVTYAESKRTLASRVIDADGTLAPLLVDESLPSKVKKPFRQRRSYHQKKSSN